MFRTLSLLLLFVSALGSARAHEVVPGPFGAILDHQKPVSFKNDEERVRYARQQQMRAFSAHFRVIEAVVSYAAPFEQVTPANANALEDLARMLPRLFAERVPMEVGRHGAKPEIWDEPDRFTLHMKGFQEAAVALKNAVADGTSLASPLISVRHQCLACHQSFRVFAAR